MENNLMEVKQNAITQKTIEDYLFSSNTKLSEQQKKLFIQIAIANNLNPFLKEVYAISYGNQFNIVTGYQVYIKRAEASQKLDGWSIDGDNETATITIHRKDYAHPIVWTVKRSDFDKNSGNWKSMPDFMLKKVAIGQGFRLAFPNELSNMPYLQEEIEDNNPHQRLNENTTQLSRTRRSVASNTSSNSNSTTNSNDTARLKSLGQIKKQVLDLLDNDSLALTEILQNEGYSDFLDLTIKEGFRILNIVKDKVKNMEALV